MLNLSRKLLAPLKNAPCILGDIESEITKSLNELLPTIQGFTARSPGDHTTQKPEDPQPNDPQPTSRRRSKKAKPVPVRTPYNPILAEDMARELVLCRLAENEERTEPRSLRQFARRPAEERPSGALSAPRDGGWPTCG
jgi:hypothetical protein